MWNHPGPGIESVSPELAGGFLTTGLPEKSNKAYLKKLVIIVHLCLVFFNRTFSESESFPPHSLLSAATKTIKVSVFLNKF